MDNTQSRRQLLFAGTGLALTAIPALGVAQGASAPQKPPKPPKLSDDLVREFVGAGHSDLEKVKKMLAEAPGLLNATWDWGGGDFEMAIGGAGHMGRLDIAQYIISQGGRYDLFVAAMLDEIETVKPMLEKRPFLIDSKGPHGITLLRHAEKGNAKQVLDLIKSIKGS